MTTPTRPPGRPTAGARSRRRQGRIAVTAAILSAILAAPAAPAAAQRDSAHAAGFCERLERLFDEVFVRSPIGRVVAALRPERLGGRRVGKPTTTPPADGLTADDGNALRPERLVRRSR